MPQFCPNLDVISKKKSLQGKMPPFSQDFDVISKKNLRSSTCWFLSVISMGPLLGPLKPTGPMMGPPKAHGPPKVHEPGVIVPPAPLS